MAGLPDFIRQAMHGWQCGLNHALDRWPLHAKHEELVGEQVAVAGIVPCDVAAALEDLEHPKDLAARAPGAFGDLRHGHRQDRLRQDLENIEPFVQSWSTIIWLAAQESVAFH